MATFNAGAPLPAASLEAAWDSWTTYTPSWTTSGTAPAIGNGTLTGRYQQIGQTVFFLAAILWGTTTTGGTGQWSLTLPVSANQPGSPLNVFYPGPGYSFDSSASATYIGTTVLASATTVIGFTVSSAAGLAASVTVTAPITWATSDRFVLGGTYEAA